jgi:hypothetical protein
MKPRLIDLLSLNFWADYIFYFGDETGLNGVSLSKKLKAVICRLKGHPRGPIYYTGPTAREPDMRCRNCGDEL